MACFIVPGTEAIVTTVVEKGIKFREDKNHTEEIGKVKLSTKLGWLNKMLWGGSALLAFEHLWHGEVTPFFPFLTAVENGETAEMLGEMGSVGVTMAVFVTLAWAGICGVSAVIEKRAKKESDTVEEV